MDQAEGDKVEVSEIANRLRVTGPQYAPRPSAVVSRTSTTTAPIMTAQQQQPPVTEMSPASAQATPVVVQEPATPAGDAQTDDFHAQFGIESMQASNVPAKKKGFFGKLFGKK